MVQQYEPKAYFTRLPNTGFKVSEYYEIGEKGHVFEGHKYCVRPLSCIINKLGVARSLLWEQEIGSSNLSTPTLEKPVTSVKKPCLTTGLLLYHIYSNFII